MDEDPKPCGQGAELDRKLSTSQAVALKDVQVAHIKGCYLAGFRVGISCCAGQLVELARTTVEECSVAVWIKEAEDRQLTVKWSEGRVANTFYVGLVESSVCELIAQNVTFFNVLRKILKRKVNAFLR